MSTRGSILLLALVSGLLVLAYVLGQKRAQATGPKVGPGVRVIDAPPAERFKPKNSAEMTQLRARLTALEKGMQDKAQPAAEQQSGAQGAQPPVDPTRMDEETREALRVREQDFATENIDPDWSPRATQSFTTELGAMGEHGLFKVESVECKTSLCRARLKWNNFSEAGANWRNVVHHTFSENCTNEVWTPPPTNPDQPYEASVYFDCTELRAGS